MAFFDTTQYYNYGDGSTTGYWAVPVWQANHTYVVGDLVRQTAPAAGSERVFVCRSSTGGTGQSGATEPTWTTSRGAPNTDNQVNFQEITGLAPFNGDLTNCPNWTTVSGQSISVGAVIVSNDGTKVLICVTAGTAGSGSEPSWSAYTTAGANTTDNTVTWRTMGTNAAGGHGFANWAAPHARLNNALTTNWFFPGGQIFVASNSAETQASALTISGAGPSLGTQQNRILCINQAGSVPPTGSDLTTGATISTTGANNLQLGSNNLGGTYWYGIAFKAGSAGNGANLVFSIQTSGNTFLQSYFDTCSFQLNNSNVASFMSVGVASLPGVMIWDNCKVKFGATAQAIALQGNNFTWKNTSATSVLESGSTVPTALIKGNGVSTNNYNMLLDGLDLSELSSNIVDVSGSSTSGGWNLLIKNCKLHASMTTPQPGLTAPTVQFVQSDSSATTYKSSRYRYEGTETTETSITRVGTLPDPGGQAQSRKIVTTANSLYTRPFVGETFALYNTATGSKTLTIYGTINSASLPNNDDIWIEAEYLGDANSPMGSFVKSCKATILTTAAAYTSDGSSWNGGGSGAGWSPFKMTVTINAQLAGWVHVRVRAAKPSATYYIDPVPVIS